MLFFRRRRLIDRIEALHTRLDDLAREVALARMDLISMQAAEEAALDEAQAIIARRARQGAPARHLSVVRDT